MGAVMHPPLAAGQRNRLRDLDPADALCRLVRRHPAGADHTEISALLNIATDDVWRLVGQLQDSGAADVIERRDRRGPLVVWRTRNANVASNVAGNAAATPSRLEMPTAASVSGA